MKLRNPVLLVVFASGVLFGQSAAPKLEFEVTSVRPAQQDAPEKTAIGIHLDGSQVHIASFSLRELVAMAYRVQRYQVTGPDWTASEHFNVSATLPAGSTSQQMPEMMQALLADRFQLKMHREKKDLPVYALVMGKPPLKLQESAPATDTGEPKGVVNVSAAGSAAGVSVDLGKGSYYTFANNKFEVKKVRMDTLAVLLERYLDRPVVNLTDLTGTYDLTLPVTDEDYRMLLVRAAVSAGITLPPQALRLLDNGTPVSLFDSVQQLGLKLDARKAPMDMLVIDQALKTPTEN
jgi:uncharacterized protein (TIGR03435 family)